MSPLTQGGRPSTYDYIENKLQTVYPMLYKSTLKNDKN